MNKFERHGSSALAAGILAVACNLRAPITSVGPLANMIRQDTGLSNTGIGLLMTVSLSLFALLSPFSARLGGRMGNRRAIGIGLATLFVGLCLRSAGHSIAFLYIGTVLIGAGIAVNNVLLPSVIKQDFPDRSGLLLISSYTTAMTVVAALGAGISVPVALACGESWRMSLLVWALPAAIALLLWLPLLRRECPARLPAQLTIPLPNDARTSLLRSALAWRVSVFMGLQCLLLYSVIAWLPDILVSHGIGRPATGWMLFLFQIVSMPSSFLAPILAGRFADQRGLTALSGGLCLAGLGGLWAGETDLVLTLSLLAVSMGGGACFSLAYAFIGLRTTNAEQAAQLSGMSQFLGYLLAATGPALIGWLFDLTGSWAVPEVVFLALAVIMLGVGIQAGHGKIAING